MNGDFIFNPWWQSLGAILFMILFLYALFYLIKDLEDEVEDEEPKTTLEIGRHEARVTRVIK